MNKKYEIMQGLIQKGLFKEAEDIIKATEDYSDCYSYTFAILELKISTPKIIEEALKRSLELKPNYKPEHGYWVHAFSHVTRFLWERHLIEWIRSLNYQVFSGANELNDANCADRLVEDFARYSKWDDDPADFHLTMSNLSWMDWMGFDYPKARIEAGRFESEVAFLTWKLRQIKSGILYKFDIAGALSDVRDIVYDLRSFEYDVSEFDELTRDLAITEIERLETQLKKVQYDWQRENIREEISELKLLLSD